MRKYQLPGWPFVMVLFAGLTCSLAVPTVAAKADAPPALNLENKKKSHPTAKKKRQCKFADKHKNEPYLFGPQLLIVMP